MLGILGSLVSSVLWDGGGRLRATIAEWSKRPSELHKVCVRVEARTGYSLDQRALARFLSRDDLVDRLLVDSSTVADILRRDAAEFGSEPEDPAGLLTALLAAIGASDLAIAQQMDRVALARGLDEINTGLGFLFQELLSELLAVRQLLEPSDKRTDRLAMLVAESDARVANGLMSLGVEEALARSLAGRADVGFDVPMNDGDVLILTAALGSGKTLAAARTHQLNLLACVFDTAAPVPILLDARYSPDIALRDRIVAASATIGDPATAGARIVLDCLDEVNRERAEQLVLEARSLVDVWPSTSFLGLSRPGISYTALPSRPLRLPDQASLQLTAAEISGRPNPFWGLPPSVREAVDLPLYAIAAAVLIRDRSEVPQSRAAIIGALVEKCRKDADVQEEAPFRELAVSLITHGSIAAEDFGIDRTGKLTASRLVVRDDSGVSFAVPIYRDWFAAKALLVNEVDLHAFSDPARFSQWSYAIALAMTLGSAAEVDSLASEIAEHAPAGIVQTISNATSHSFGGEQTTTPPINPKQRLRTAHAALYEPFKGVLRSVGREALDPQHTVIRASNRSVSIEYRNAEGTTVRELHTALSTRDSAWPWKIMADRLVGDIRSVLERRALAIDHPLADEENAWAVARLVAGQTSAPHAPIDAGGVLDGLAGALAMPPDEPILLHGRLSKLWLGAGCLVRAASLIQDRADRGLTLDRPWPTPQQATPNGSRDELYVPTEAAFLFRATLTGAIQLYVSLVETWFPEIAASLATYASMPMVLRCTLEAGGSPLGYVSTTSWHPLPPDEASRVCIAVTEGPPQIDWSEAWAKATEEWSAAGRDTPPTGAMLGISHGIVPGLHSHRPATHAAYQWLESDLERLDLSEGPRRHEYPD